VPDYTTARATPAAIYWRATSSGGAPPGPPVPPTPALPSFADAETPAGACTGTDGTDGNPLFTLAHAPSPAASLHAESRGVGNLFAGVHYTLAGATMTFLSGFIPLAGDEIRVSYRY
jgi:hypothetical protein